MKLHFGHHFGYNQQNFRFKEMRMKKGFIVTMSLVLFLASSALVTQGYTYGVYYASFADQDTALVIMNSGGSNTYYTLKVYDSLGSLIDAVSEDLEPFESDYQVMSDITGITDSSWGLALLDSPGILTIGVETFVGNDWLASDNIIDPVPETIDYSYYWYSLNYSNTYTQTTGIAIVNPYGSPAAATLTFYNSLGEMQYTDDVVLDPHQTKYYLTSELLASAASMWGALDVRGTTPLILVAEYFSAEEILVNVDQITHAYFTE
jgi:hypothetical protein